MIHIMLFDSITAYEKEVFNTLFQTLYCFAAREMFQRTHSVKKNICLRGMRFWPLLNFITFTYFYLLH